MNKHRGLFADYSITNMKHIKSTNGWNFSLFSLSQTGIYAQKRKWKQRKSLFPFPWLGWQDSTADTVNGFSAIA